MPMQNTGMAAHSLGNLVTTMRCWHREGLLSRWLRPGDKPSARAYPPFGRDDGSRDGWAPPRQHSLRTSLHLPKSLLGLVT